MRSLILVPAFAALVACSGGGSSVSPAPRSTPTPVVTASPGGAPPATLVAITPEPGVDPVPSPNATFATFASALPSGTPIPNFSPAPAPSGADLQALLAGRPPSQAFFASLRDPRAAQYPLPDSAPKGIVGSIVSFLPDGFVIDTPPLSDANTASELGVPYFASLSANAAPQVTAHVSGATDDQVPGGYGALRAGAEVLVLGAGPASDFIADAVIGAPAGSSTASEAIWPMRRGSVTRSSPATEARPAIDSAVQSYTPFDITAVHGLGDLVLQTPQNFASEAWGCLTKTSSTTITAGASQTATYPMQLQDVSDPKRFFENTEQSFPVRLVDAPASGNATYRINYGAAFNTGLALTAGNNCKNITPGTVYNVGLITLGQDFESETSDPLPGVGVPSAIKSVSCPFFPLTAIEKAPSHVLNTADSPNISICLNFTLFGAPVIANATVTHSMISAAPQVPGYPAFTDTTFPFMADPTSGGDPGVQILPLSAASGQIQPIELSLTGVTYDPHLEVIASISVALGLNSPPYMVGPFPAEPVFETFGKPTQGVTSVSPILLDLTPSAGSLNGGVH